MKGWINEMKKKKKFLAIICFVIFIVFVILNSIWFLYVHTKYHKYELAIGYDDKRQRYIYRDEDDFVYSVSKPYYLQYTGNLAISQVITIDEKGNALNENLVSLIIWPDIWGNYEYGVTVEILDKSSQAPDASYISYEFLLDENKQPLEQLNEHDKNILSSNQDAINTLFEKSKKMWNIPHEN